MKNKKSFSARLLSIPSLVFALLLFSACGSSGDKSSTQTVDDAYVDLFKNIDLSQWDLMVRSGDSTELSKVFTFADNQVLHVFRDLPDEYGNKENRNSTHGVMATTKSYSRFSVKFEYKWGKKLLNNFDQYQYDAGFFYHIQKMKVFPLCLQFQVRYNHLTNKNHSGDILGAISRDWYSCNDTTFCLPSQGGKPKTTKRGMNSAAIDAPFNGLNDKWNECEIIVMDSSYAIHKLNGKVVNLATNLGAAQGPIGLESETGEIYWKNVKIKEFDKRIPMEEFLK